MVPGRLSPQIVHTHTHTSVREIANFRYKMVPSTCTVVKQKRDSMKWGGGGGGGGEGGGGRASAMPTDEDTHIASNEHFQ